MQIATDLWENPYAAARRKGTTRHAVFVAAAARILRSQIVAGHLVVLRTDVDAWEPKRRRSRARR